MTCATRWCPACRRESQWSGPAKRCPECKAAPVVLPVAVARLPRESRAALKEGARQFLESGLSQEEVSRRTGVHVRTLAAWVRRGDWAPQDTAREDAPGPGSKLEWARRLRERVGPGVCLYCQGHLVQTGGRPREICGSEDCRREWHRDYDCGGRVSETPDWVLDAVGELKAGRQRLDYLLSTLKAAMAEHLREA